MISNSIKIQFIVLLVTFACSKKNQNINEDPIPYVQVNSSINLALQGSFTMIPGSFFYDVGGYRGLVIIHDFEGNIRVFDRACSYQPQNECSVLEIDSNTIQMRCGNYENGSFKSCCESKFNLFGFPVTQPAIYPLREYRTSRSGNILNVFN